VAPEKSAPTKLSLYPKLWEAKVKLIPLKFTPSKVVTALVVKDSAEKEVTPRAEKSRPVRVLPSAILRPAEVQAVMLFGLVTVSTVTSIVTVVSVST